MATKRAPKRTRAIGYVRVSSDRQRDDGYGLELQEQAIRRYCRQERLELVMVLKDEAVSGSLSDRPGLGSALAQLEEGAGDALVVYRLDRLARDLVLQETVIERLAKRGKRVLSVTETDIDGDDPTRVLVRQVLGAISQYEKAVISARLLSGRIAKAARGGYAFGAPPFGWAASDKQLVPVPGELEAIRMAKRLKRRGKSLREIARALGEAGHRPKRADQWSAEMVSRLLKRRVPRRVK